MSMLDARSVLALHPQLPPGVHVIASSPRQANWLWALAVEQHVSSALMAQVSAGGRSRQPHAFQLHLLAPAS